MPGTLSRERGQQGQQAEAAQVHFPDGLCNEILQMIIASDCGLSGSDLKSLRRVCKRLDEAVTPVLFRTVVCSSLWKDRNNFLSIAGSPRLAGSVKTLLWLELSPMVPETGSIREGLRAGADDLDVARLQLGKVLMDDPNPVFWISPVDFSMMASIRDRHEFIAPFRNAISAMPKLTRVEVRHMRQDRVIWTSPTGFEFTARNIVNFDPGYGRFSSTLDGGGAQYGIEAISLIGRVAGTPGTGPPGIDPVFVWEETEYPTYRNLHLAFRLDDFPRDVLEYIRELSLALTNEVDPDPNPAPIGTMTRLRTGLTDLSGDLYGAKHLKKLCLDWKAWAFTDDAAHTPLRYLIPADQGHIPISPCLEVLIIRHHEHDGELAPFLADVLKSHGGSVRTLRLENCKTSVKVMRALFQDDVPRVAELVVIEDGALVYKGETKGIVDFLGGVRFPFKLPPLDYFEIRDHTCDPFVVEGFCGLLHHLIDYREADQEDDEEDDEEDDQDGQGAGEGAGGGQGEVGASAEKITSLNQLIRKGSRASWNGQCWEPDQDGSDGEEYDSEDDDPGYRYRTAPYWTYRPYKGRNYAGAIYCPVPADYPFAHPTTIWMLTRRRGLTRLGEYNLIDKPVFTWLAPDEHYENWDESLGDKAHPTPLNWELAALACLAKGGHHAGLAKDLLAFNGGGIPPFPRLPLDNRYFPDPVAMDERTRTRKFRLPDDPAKGGYFADEALLSPGDYLDALNERAQWEWEQEIPKTPWYEVPLVSVG
ncbi:hypothetical protein RB595_008091 [Gaeumannomyces hyphopodioides]